MRQLHLAKALLVLILMSWCVSRIGFLFSHEYGDDRAEGVRAALGVVALAALAGTALLAALRVIPRHLTVLTVVFVAACALAPYPMVGDPWGPVAGLASAIALFLLPKHHSCWCSCCSSPQTSPPHLSSRPGRHPKLSSGDS